MVSLRVLRSPNWPEYTHIGQVLLQTVMETQTKVMVRKIVYHQTAGTGIINPILDTRISVRPSVRHAQTTPPGF